MSEIVNKRIYYLDGTAACYKSSILSKLQQDNICFTTSSDLIHLRNDFPAFYTHEDGFQYNTISWYSMYQSQMFLNGKIGNNYNIMCCDRSPIASLIYGIINKKGKKISAQDLEEILPSWICDYLNSTNVVFLIDTNINAVKDRVIKRGDFDVILATDEYFVLQNIYFKSIAETCNAPYFDINGKSFSDVYEYIFNWVTNI